MRQILEYNTLNLRVWHNNVINFGQKKLYETNLREWHINVISFRQKKLYETNLRV